MVLPMASQQKKKATTQVRRTTVSQPTKTTFEFKIQWDASFKKEGENNFYVVNFGRKSAHQLYMDVLSHIASIYKNPDYVTSKVEDRSIVINGYAGDIAFFKDHWGITILQDLNIEWNSNLRRVRFVLTHLRHLICMLKVQAKQRNTVIMILLQMFSSIYLAQRQIR